MIRDKVRAREMIKLLEWNIDHCPEYNIVMMIDSSRIIDAVACVRNILWQLLLIEGWIYLLG